MNQVQEFLTQVTVVDTETTGNDYNASEIVEVASGKFHDGEWNVLKTLVKPVRPIPPDASAIHHISNKMVASYPLFDDMLDIFDEILDYSNTKLMVAHNSDFDRKMLYEAYSRCFSFERFEPFENKENWICTWRLAKAVLGIDYQLMQYGLSYLRYYLDLDVSDELTAHRAEADVITCGKLLEKLLEIAIEKNLVDINEEIGDQLVSLCWNPIKVGVWYIGKKYKGSKLEEIPTDYYVWAIENLDELNEKHPNYNLDLATSVTKILEGRL